MSGLEQNAPGSSEMKIKATGGTTGKYSGVPEYELNLEISMMLRTELETMGYDVLMTRENDDTAISNAERAQLANNAGADASVRIHANGSEDSSVNGALVLIGSEDNPYVGKLYEESKDLGKTVLDTYCKETGMKNLGVQTNDTMTGINWSSIPVIILEMGFMTNEQDDRNMADEDYREKMVTGIAAGIDQYFSKKNSNELERKIREKISREKEYGTEVSVYAEKLGENITAVVDSVPMESASLIKLFIAGCVYEHMDEVAAAESYVGETENLIQSMISISDNTAANTLTERLGSGNAAKGMELLNNFCEKHGYVDTFMGRLMLASNAEADNYTSVQDCGKILKDIYKKELVGSEKILHYMEAQERTTKIPAGVPTGIRIANKTGELSDVENDVAIVYGESGTYILCVMMSNLSDVARGRNVITELSTEVYAYMEK